MNKVPYEKSDDYSIVTGFQSNVSLPFTLIHVSVLYFDPNCHF